ncbi:hypothetical protein ZIOFF_018170 [Zingiber officinale]|uniref:Uncharacterized protein n=1 Tax=Zingiber officinale TaxID=94328 RepID=A0A8J5H7V4_ZINOF|nr:hypothetical protein ZIOFF_018170 [Zingiber officinale]
MVVTILDWGSTEGAELELRLGGQGIGSQSNLIQRQNNGLFCFRYSSFYLSDYCSFDTGIPVHLLTISAVTANPFKRLMVWMSMSGTVEGSSLNPNALHSVLQQLRESVQALLEHFHQWRQQEMAGKDLFETASVEALVMKLSTKSPKKGVRPVEMFDFRLEESPVRMFDTRLEIEMSNFRWVKSRCVIPAG